MSEGWPLVILYGLAILTVAVLIVKNEYFSGGHDHKYRYGYREWN